MLAYHGNETPQRVKHLGQHCLMKLIVCTNLYHSSWGHLIILSDCLAMSPYSTAKSFILQGLCCHIGYNLLVRVTWTWDLGFNVATSLIPKDWPGSSLKSNPIRNLVRITFVCIYKQIQMMHCWIRMKAAPVAKTRCVMTFNWQFCHFEDSRWTGNTFSSLTTAGTQIKTCYVLLCLSLPGQMSGQCNFWVPGRMENNCILGFSPLHLGQISQVWILKGP